MSDKKYEVIQLPFDRIGMSVRILKMDNKEDIESELSMFSKEKGLISKVRYEDYILSVYVINIGQLLYFVNSNKNLVSSFDVFREELLEKLYKINPLLNPDGLIVNPFGLIKVDDDGNADGYPFVENPSWNTDNVSAENAVFDGKTVDDIVGSDDIPTEDHESEKQNKTKLEDHILKTIRSVKKIKHIYVKKWWDRLIMYVIIRKFEADNIKKVILMGNYEDEPSYKSFIITSLIKDIESVFGLIDRFGLLTKFTPQQMVDELYELCIEINPGADYKKLNKKTNTAASSAKRVVQKTEYKALKDISSDKLLNLENELNKLVIGQHGAINNIVRALKRSKIGIKDPACPIGSFLLAGKTGVGKTLLAKVLADELFKKEADGGFVRIDCSEYTADHEYAKLIGCFVPNTNILMDDGSLKPIQDIVIGDYVITHKGRVKKVVKTHEYEQDGDMVKFTTVNSNIPVTTTKTHEIFAIKGKQCDKRNNYKRICTPRCPVEYCTKRHHEEYKLNWMPAKGLEKGDIVAYPRYKPTGNYPKILDLADYIQDSTRYKFDDKYIWAQKQIKVNRFIPVNEDLMRLAGYFVSEGGSKSSTNNSINFTFNTKEIKYVTEVMAKIRRLFGQEVSIKIEDRSKNNSYRLWICSVIISNFMSTLFGKNTYVKKVPSWFKDIPDSLVINFLETAIFGDGCTVIPRRIDYSTVSSSLFSQVQLLFRRLGYITSVCLEPVGNSKKRTVDRYRLYVGGDQIEKINEMFNFNVDLKDLPSTHIQRMSWIDDDYVYLQIKKIETINYTGKVYDLSIKDDISYVASVGVHNSPAGYVRSDEGGILTNAILKDPFSVVLFDEVEKASEKVHQLMLQIMDEGRLTDNHGEVVSFKDTLILMTSNIGATEVQGIGKTIGFGDVNKVTNKRKNVVIEKAIKDLFKPEFLNRLTGTIYFNDMDKKACSKIIELELDKLNNYLKDKHIFINFSLAVKRLILKKGYSETYGAREIKRTVESIVSDSLADYFIRNCIEKDTVISTKVKNKKVIYKHCDTITNFVSEKTVTNKCDNCTKCCN